MSPPIPCQSHQPDSEKYAEVLASPGGTQYLRPVKPTTEPAMTAARQPEYKPVATLTQKLTLASILLGIVLVVWDRGKVQGQYDESLSQVKEAFKESVKETSNSIAAMRDVVFELGRQQAVTNSKINTLEEWKRMLDAAKRQ